jgi:hypothetical protein
MNKQEFKKRYRPDEWAKLINDESFLQCFDSDDFEKATAVAAEFLHGTARNRSEHKELRFKKHMEDEYR